MEISRKELKYRKREEERRRKQQQTILRMMGIVQAKDLLTRLLAGQPVDLRAIAQPPVYVPETKPGLQVIELFRETRMHIALVIDEYGGLLGLVTINDILEDIVGTCLQSAS